VVPVAVDEAHRRWLDFTGQGTTADDPSGGGARSPGQELEVGRVYFSEERGRATRVTVELRYNARALREADRDDAWVARRIELYLRRFSDQVGR
jgi:hypothetical protein